MRKEIYLGLTLSMILLFMSSLSAQEDKSERKSPPVIESKTLGDLTITIDYSSPSVNGREIWGSLVKYDKVWRSGANEATTITFNRDVAIEGHALDSGTYALFSIPSVGGDWLIIFNKDPNQWGSYKYKKKRDALRVNVLAKKQDEMVEKLKFTISDEAHVTMSWEHLTVSFDVD